ncbi:hypothetical protein ABK040_015533 [Willaertia magna]
MQHENHRILMAGPQTKTNNMAFNGFYHSNGHHSINNNNHGNVGIPKNAYEHDVKFRSSMMDKNSNTSYPQTSNNFQINNTGKNNMFDNDSYRNVFHNGNNGRITDEESTGSSNSSTGSSELSFGSTPTIKTNNNRKSVTYANNDMDDLALTPTINTNFKKVQSPTFSPNNRRNKERFVGGNNYNQQQNTVNNEATKKTLALRSQYLNYCKQYNVEPSQEMIRSLKTSIKNQEPFSKLSICHAQVDDNHVKVLIQSLHSCQQQGNNKNNTRKTNSLATYDVNEILLNHNQITDKGASLIIKELLLPSSIYYNQLTSIELFGNQLGNECCKILGEMLKQNKVLKRLKLGDNQIGSEGAKYLGEGLSYNTTLSQLHLGGNNIDAIGVKSIANALIDNTTLTSLGLRDNNIGSEGMKYLAETLKSPKTQLSDIQLKGNNIKAVGAGFLSSALIPNQSLKVLELQSNAIGPVGCKSLCQALKDNHSVHALNFNDNELGDEGAVYVANLLKSNPSITTLGLANNRIRKKGACALAEALKFEQTAITGLDLGNNEIGNGGAVSLAQALSVNKVLTSLDLRSCEIHLKGILALSEVCEVNTSLRHLDLGANYAKNQGASSWATVLSRNKTLTRLCLTDNQIYHEGGEALCVGLQNNYTLRNFSYGGQGAQANRIDSSIRRIIDSIISENKKHWEMVQQNGTTEVTSYQSNNPLRFLDIQKMRLQQMLFNQRLGGNVTMSPMSPIDEDNTNNNLDLNSMMSPSSPLDSLSDLSLDVNSKGNLPNWLLSSLHIPRPTISEEFDAKLESIFKSKLLKAENPKFKGCYFIGNIINTLRKVHPEVRIDEVQLVQYAMNNPKYYVHLSREMVKTQIKYVGSQSDNNDLFETPKLRIPEKRQSLALDSYGKTQLDNLVFMNDRQSFNNYQTTSTAPSGTDLSTSPPTINTNLFPAPISKRAYTDPGFLESRSVNYNPFGNFLMSPTEEKQDNFSLYSPLYQPSSFNNNVQNRTLSPYDSFGYQSPVATSGYNMFNNTQSGYDNYNSLTSPTSMHSKQVLGAIGRPQNDSDDMKNRYNNMVNHLLN